MLAQPSIIKRPGARVGGGKLLVGFKPEAYAAAFAKCVQIGGAWTRHSNRAASYDHRLRIERERLSWKSHSPAAPPSSQAAQKVSASPSRRALQRRARMSRSSRAAARRSTPP